MSDLPKKLREHATWLESRSFAVLDGSLDRLAAKEIERLRAIVDPLNELTANSAASVIFFEVAGAEMEEKFCVIVNVVQPPLPVYFYGATYAEALAKAAEAKEPSDV